MSVWKASINDVKELPSQVSFHVSVPWGVVPYDFSLVVSFALWLWVVRELVFVAAQREREREREFRGDQGWTTL